MVSKFVSILGKYNAQTFYMLNQNIRSLRLWTGPTILKPSGITNYWDKYPENKTKQKLQQIHAAVSTNGTRAMTRPLRCGNRASPKWKTFSIQSRRLDCWLSSVTSSEPHDTAFSTVHQPRWHRLPQHTAAVTAESFRETSLMGRVYGHREWHHINRNHVATTILLNGNRYGWLCSW